MANNVNFYKGSNISNATADANGLYIVDGSSVAHMYYGSNKHIVGPTYTISKSGSTITLSGSDGSKTSVTDSNTTYSVVTTSAAGLMSAADKSKLDGIATGANKYSLPTASSSILGGVKTTSTVTSTSGLTACPIISGVPYYKDSNTTYSAATTSSAGLMTAEDKTKLDGITASADSVSVSRSLTSGTKVGTITINGTGTDLYAPKNTDTHYITRIYAGAPSTTVNDSATSPYIKITDDNTYRNQIRLVGSGATTVKSDTSGNITISSTVATQDSNGLMSADDKQYVSSLQSAIKGGVTGNNYPWAYAGEFRGVDTCNRGHCYSIGSNELGGDGNMHTYMIGNNSYISNSGTSFIFGEDCGVYDSNYCVMIGYGCTSDTEQATCIGRYVPGSSYQLHIGNFGEWTQGPYTAGSTSGAVFVVGNGTSTSNRRRIFKIEGGGEVYLLGSVHTGGADIAEFFEYSDGNTTGEDRRGLMVTLDGDRIRLANNGDKILGIVSSNPSYVGNSASEEWHNKYLRDVFGKILTEETVVPEHVDEKTGKVIPEQVSTIPMLNPEFDSSSTYVSRQNRNEWDMIGLLGQVVAVDDGTCKAGEYCTVSKNGVATYTETETRFYCMKRMDMNHVKIYIER